MGRRGECGKRWEATERKIDCGLSVQLDERGGGGERLWHEWDSEGKRRYYGMGETVSWKEERVWNDWDSDVKEGRLWNYCGGGVVC